MKDKELDFYKITISHKGEELFSKKYYGNRIIGLMGNAFDEFSKNLEFDINYDELTINLENTK
jgi:hypothetical protein